MKVGFKLKKGELEDPTAPRKPPHLVLGMEGGGSPFGSTRYKRTRLCPFEQGLIQIARLRPLRQKEPLDVGWIFHAALERYYNVFLEHHKAPLPEPFKGEAMFQYLWGPTNEAEAAAMATVEAFKDEPNYGATYEVVSRLVSAYLDRYRRTDLWRIVGNEETVVFEQELAEPIVFTNAAGERIEQTHFRYSCRYDLVIERYDPGKEGLWIGEHKSARMISEDLLAGYQLDMQILGQAWLLKNCVDLSKYPPFKGVCVNITSKHKTPQFERVDVMPSQYHLAEFERSSRQWAFLNSVFEAAGWPRALGACAGALRGYSKCSFYDLCYAHPEWTIEDFAREEPAYGFYKEERDLEDYVIDGDIL